MQRHLGLQMPNSPYIWHLHSPILMLVLILTLLTIQNSIKWVVSLAENFNFFPNNSCSQPTLNCYLLLVHIIEHRRDYLLSLREILVASIPSPSPIRLPLKGDFIQTFFFFFNFFHERVRLLLETTYIITNLQMAYCRRNCSQWLNCKAKSYWREAARATYCNRGEELKVSYLY